MKRMFSGKTGQLFLIFCMVAICISVSYARAGQNKHVLVLHSYHKGQTWNDLITEGIESVLTGSDKAIELHFEYMDTKRIYDAQYLEQLYELYRHKYKNRKFDVIISSDNHAFNFLLAHHRERFPGTPVVFCGVNGFKDSMLQGHDLITGVVEENDIKSSIDVALKLQPETREVFVIADKTLTGTIAKKPVMEIIPYFKDRLKFTFLDDLTMPQLLERVKTLPDDSIIFLEAFITDSAGDTFSFKETGELISRHSAVPVYTSSDAYYKQGVLGGLLTCGYSQGEKAAEIALRILNGEKASDIPVIKKNPNRYEFDYQQMKRFGISFSRLPEGANIYNGPTSFYSIHKRLVWSVAASSVGLVLIVIILSTNTIIRRRAEKALRESNDRHIAMIANIGDVIGIIDADGIIKYVSSNIERWFGWKPEDLVGTDGWKTVHPEDIERLQKEFHAGIEKDNFSTTIEYRNRCKDGSYRWIELTAVNCVSDPLINGELLNYHDITKRKQLEETLKKSEGKYRTLFEAESDAVFILDEETGDILDVNEAALQLYGYSREEITALKAMDLSAEPEKTEITIRVPDKSFVPVRYHRKKDGTVFVVEIASNDFELNGRRTNVSAIRNITERKQAEDILRESQEKYRDLVDLLPQTVFELDERGTFTFANRFGLESIGYTQEDLDKGLNAADTVIPDDRPRVMENLQKRWIGVDTGEHEYTALRKDGSTFPFIIHAAPVIRDNKPAGLRGVSIDITNRKKAEQALKEAAQRLTDIINFLPDASLAIDLEGRVIAWNRAIEEMTGIKAEDIMGKGNYEYAIPFYGTRRPILIDLVFIQDRETEKQYSNLQREKDVLFDEAVDLVINGQKKVVWTKASPVCDSGGNVIGAIETIRDITNQKRMQDSLRKSDDRYRTLVETMTDGLFIRDENDLITYANDQFCEMLGYSMDEIIGHPVIEFLDEANRKIVKKQILDRKAGIDISYELVWSGKDKKNIPTIVSPKRITDVDGSYRGSFAVVTDTTALKKAEKKIGTSLKEKEVLLAEIHHRVKNNLQIISSFLDMKIMRTDDQQVINLFEDARSKIHTMAMIHSQLYQSEQFGRIEMKRHIIELVDYLSQVYAGEKRITHAVKTSGIYLSLNHAMPCALVINELVSNAFKHGFTGRDEGSIEISMQETKDRKIILAVKDDGAGIPEDIDIFNTSTLGLKLVKNTIIGQLQGEMRVERNEGTTIIAEFKTVDAGEGRTKNAKNIDSR